jgi:hypothetical protein
MKATAIAAAWILAMAQPVVARADERVDDAAREALRTGDFSPIAIWVEQPQEPTLQAAFRHALAVRALGPKGRDLAERYLIDTMTRLHEVEACSPPATAEREIAIDDEDALVASLVTHVRAQLRDRYRDLANHRVRRRGDIASGRAYVARYRELVRYVTAVYAAAASALPPDEEHDHYEY